MIGNILQGKKPLVSVTRAARIGEILELLDRHRIGAVLVIESGQIYGLVSERDICRSLNALGSQLLEQTAVAVMSSPVVTARVSDSVASAMEVMTDRRFRHLPVVEGGRILGLVSIGDLVKYRIQEIESEAAALKTYIAS